MKTKIFSLLFIACIVAPSLIVVTNTIQSTPLLYGSEEFYMEADLSTIDGYADILGNVNPFWHDLVDKENVANDGEGVYIAVLDTGLLPYWSMFFDIDNIAWELGKGFSHDAWYDEGIVFGDLRDDRGYYTDLASGHGTHLVSTILGFNYGDIYWIEGIAPKATIIPVLVLDAWLVDTPEGLVGLSGGTDEMISAGIYYIANLADTLDGPVIINMSLGGPTPTQMIEDAIDYAISKGVIIVCSAGNEGEAGMGYPGAYDQVISCAACGWTPMFGYGWGSDVPEELDTPDFLGNDYQVYLEDFSSRPNPDLGQKYTDLDVMAPGAWIVGPYKSAWAPVGDYGYYYVSGTSMAAPHVSAMAALILELYPTFTQKDVEHILKIAAGGVGKNYDRGFPKTGEDVWVYFPYEEEGYYSLSWGRHDYGRGFLQADEAMFYAAHYKVGHNK